MAPLLNAKAWFKRRRSKNKRNAEPTPTFIPGIGYPPARNSSQPTLIPYIPPEERSSTSESEDDEPEYEPISDMVSAATTTCVGVSAAMARRIHAEDNDICHHQYHHHGARPYGQLTGAESATTLAPTPPHRRSSLQPPTNPFVAGYSRKHSGSHSSLPTQILTGESVTDLAAPLRNLSRNLNFLTKRSQFGSDQTPHTLPLPQPQPGVRDRQGSKSPNALKAISCKFSASTDAVNLTETKAQEYARTVKTLWEMVADEELAYRLADASPVEREWLIFNHKNAKFPLQAVVATAPIHAARPSGESTRCRGGHNLLHGREPRLSCIEDANEEEEMMEPGNEPSSFHHRKGCPFSGGGFHTHDESDDIHVPVMMSLPNSPRAGPVDSKVARRSTLLSAVALQSATELQKRDHFTIQQRVDMEEDWRMQARLVRSVGEQQDRSRGVRRVHAQLLERQQRQRALESQVPAIQEYEPTHEDFNRWYDLKEEIEDDVVPDLNDNVRKVALKEDFENEGERKKREAMELEEKKRRELEELEHELNILGIERFEGLMSFVEPDKPRGPQEFPQMTSEQLLLNQQKQQLLHQQLQDQYEQLHHQLKLHHDQTVMAEKGGVGKVKGLQLKRNAAAPGVVSVVLSPKLVPRSPAMGATAKVMPLRPRNGRNLFASDCDSMIINDMPLISAPARMM